MEKPIMILYVDDNPLDRELVRDALEKEHGGFQVVEATDRADFEAQLAAGTYDLVLSDFNILGFEGVQVIDTVHAQNPLMPVVVVTGTGSEEIAVEALKRGAADYVIKTPRYIQHLPRTIQAVLEGKRLKEEREQAEVHMRRQTAILSALFNSPQETVALLDVNGVILNVNQNGARRFGMSSQEMIGKNVYDLILEPVCSARKRIITEVMRTGQAAHFEDERAGMHLTNSVYPVSDPQSGQLLGTAIFATDVTERRQAEKALQESEARLKEAQALGQIGSWEFDAIRQTIIWSDQVYKLYERDPSLGPPSAEEEATYYTPQQVQRLREYARRALQAGESFEYDLGAHLPSGRIAHFAATMRPIKDETERIVKLFGTVQDITTRKQAEAQLTEQLEELRRWHAATLNRETRILDLKREVNDLLRRLNEPVRYPSAEVSSQ